MKKINKWMLLFLFGILGTGMQAKAQSSFPHYDEISDYFDTDQMTALADAESKLMDGDDFYSKSEQAYQDVVKLFSKRNTKKAEKKSVPSKQLRIQAYKKYQSSYEQAYEIYKEVYSKLVFSAPNMKKQGEDFVREADTHKSSADNIMTKYQSQTAKTLQTLQYSELKRDLDASKQQYEDAVESLGKAILKHKEDVKLKKDSQAEDAAWQVATTDNTIDSYQGYLNSFPRGKYAATAKQIIEQIEENSRQTAASQTATVFKVQIAASMASLTPQRLSQIYKGQDAVSTETFNGERYKYKYTLGSFKTYAEASQYKARIGVSGAFIVAYQNGARIAITKNVKGQ